MRRFPVSWDKTLTALGFKRKSTRVKRDHYARKNSRFESLEVRALLSGNQPQYAFVVEDDAEYDPASQFVLSTEYDGGTGAPRAVLSLRNDLATDEVEIGLQEVELELVDDGALIESQVILVDIAESEFLSLFRADRLDQVDETLSGEVEDPQTVVAGDFTLEELLDVEAFELGRQDGSVGVSESAGYYEAYRLALVDAADREDNAPTYEEFEAAAIERHALSSAAVLLTGRLVQDATSSDPQLAASANGLRGALFEHGEYAHTTFAGLGVNQELVRESRLGGAQEFVIALVEEPEFAAGASLRVELGGSLAMVQAAITNEGLAGGSSQSSQDVSLGHPNVTDVSIDALGGDPASTTLTVERSGPDEEHALLWFDLSSWTLDGTLPDTATLDLTATSAPSTGVEQSVSAHWDAWGLTTPDQWSAAQVTWADYDPSLPNAEGAEFGQTVTQTVSGPGQVQFTVTEAVQRALLAGDSNLDGTFDPLGAGQRGDIDAAYMAVRDPARYAEIYGGLEIVEDGLLYRNDINQDGVVDSSDFNLIAKRLGFKAGDFNLDGVVDGYDYAIWQENYARAATIFQHGDANADGLVTDLDYTVWRDTEDLSHDPSPPTPNLALRVTPGDDGLNGEVIYTSADVSSGGPKINADLTSELLLTGFTASSQLG